MLLKKTKASSQNVGKISFLPSEVVKKRQRFIILSTGILTYQYHCYTFTLGALFCRWQPGLRCAATWRWCCPPWTLCSSAGRRGFGSSSREFPYYSSWPRRLWKYDIVCYILCAICRIYILYVVCWFDLLVPTAIFYILLLWFEPWSCMCVCVCVCGGAGSGHQKCR